MDEVVIFRALFSLLLLVGGGLIKVLWSVVNANKKATEKNDDAIQQLELKVAYEYISKSNFDKTMDVVFAKLDRIEDKLDKKQDKC